MKKPNTLYLSAIAAKLEREQREIIEKYGEDYDRTVFSFPITKCEQEAITQWLNSLEPEIQEKSNGSYGATGGNVSYTFIPTSLGIILTVKETITGKELNVSDAVNWVLYG